MQSVAIILNPEIEAAGKLASEITNLLEMQRVLVIAEHDAALAIGRPDLSRAEGELVKADFALVFGGDGTLLRASRIMTPHGVPMLGIRLGKFGFLTDVEPCDARAAVLRMMEGEYAVDERMVLRMDVRRNGKRIERWQALNDVVVAKGPLARMLRLGTYVSEKYVSTYAADGIIIASPTGSTAYSLSAGGPLVAPDLNILIVTPICPHTLSARSLVVSSKETVHVKVESDPGDVVMATVDGQVGMPLEPGDEVIVGEAPVRAKLISVTSTTFYDKLQTRLKWGDRFDL
ncbi:MAG: NAD(+)/NADH kinase [Armatimonadota bacterium]|nr:NAD(+)/NADH kinase [Armatimonadota bacterium]